MHSAARAAAFSDATGRPSNRCSGSGIGREEWSCGAEDAQACQEAKVAVAVKLISNRFCLWSHKIDRRIAFQLHNVSAITVSSDSLRKDMRLEGDGGRLEEMGGDGRQCGASCCCASLLDFDLAQRDIGVCETQASAKLRADCRAGEVGKGRGLSVGVSRPRPVDSKRFHRNVANIQGFAQALQGSNEEEARDRMNGHGEGSAGHGAGTHICDAGVMTAVGCWQPWQRRQRQDPGRRQAWFGRAARLHLCEALLLLQLWSPERGRAWLGTSFAFLTSA